MEWWAVAIVGGVVVALIGWNLVSQRKLDRTHRQALADHRQAADDASDTATGIHETQIRDLARAHGRRDDPQP